MQQEIRLLHIKVVVGYYVVKAFYYILLLLKVTIYSVVRGYHAFLVRIVCQKWKPQIDGFF
jgi:hypothetical protein